MDQNILVIVRAYEELNAYLPAEHWKTDFSVNLGAGADVRSLLSQLGIPETQVDLLLVNGRSAALDRLLEDRDRIAIYPVFESLDISGVSRNRRSTLRHPKFITDQDLTELSEGLRSQGFDVLHLSRETSEEGIERLNKEGRILLTRNSAFAAEKAFDRVILIKASDPTDQVKEVIERLDLQGMMMTPSA